MSAEAENRVARQERISVDPLPKAAVEFLCHLESNLPEIGVYVRLSYVPYKAALSAEMFTAYLNDLPIPENQECLLEACAALILDDLNNELVPRWLQLVLTRGLEDGTVQSVLVEDKQPRWDNKVLLGRAQGI